MSKPPRIGLSIQRTPAGKGVRSIGAGAFALLVSAGACYAEPVPLDCLAELTQYTDAGRETFSIHAHAGYLAVQGKSGSGTSIRLWDVSDPAEPTVASAFASWPGYQPSILTMSHPLVAASNGQFAAGPLYVFDFSDPDAPVQTAVVGTEVDAAELVNDILYVIESGTLSVYDLTNPAAPALLGSIAGVSATDIATSPGRLYLAGDAVRIVDVSDPGNPALLGSYASGQVSGVAIDGDTVFAAASGNLLVIDVSNPTSPTLRSQVALSFPAPGNVEVAGTIAYVAQYGRTVDRVDVSDPDNPTLIDPLGSPSFMGEIQMARSGGALFALGASGFSLIDTTPPHTSGTSLLGQVGPSILPSNARIADAAFAAGTGYLCDSVNSVLYVVDADPSAPGLVGSLSLPFSPRAIELVGLTALVAGNDNQLYVVDVSNPAAPSAAGSLTLPVWNVVAMNRAGELLFLSGGESFVIVDVTDPSLPAVLGHQTTSIGEWVQDLDGNADTLAVLELSSQPGPDSYFLTLIDITDPTTPVEIDRRMLDGTGRRVAVEGDVAVVTEYDGDFKWYVPGTLTTYDISTGSPEPLASISFHRTGDPEMGTMEFSGLLVEGTIALVSQRAAPASNLVAIDIADPANLRLAASSLGSPADWIASDGNRVYAGQAVRNRFDVYLSGPCNPGCAAADIAEPYGSVDFFDLAAYLNLFNAQDAAADLAEPFGAFNFFDVAAYLDLYLQGCP
jgi:hypothetical protein